MIKKIIKRVFSINKIDGIQKDIAVIKSELSVCRSSLASIAANDKIKLNMELLDRFPGKTIWEAKKSLLSSYPKATGFLRDVQNCNLRLLKDLKAECDSLGIQFWLHAGTLIGALRHSGFIPWDDDVDIGMERKDFNALREHLKSNLRFVLLEFYNQITHTRQYQLKYNNEIPCFIDVVIWDKSNAKTPAQIVEHREKFAEVRGLLNTQMLALSLPPVIDCGYYMLGRYEDDVKTKVDAIIDEAIGSFAFNESDADYSLFYAIENYPFAYPLMLQCQQYPLKSVSFEDTSFYVPQDGETYLKGYGDIYLPPANIDAQPHIYAFMPYKNMIQDFLKGENHG